MAKKMSAQRKAILEELETSILDADRGDLLMTSEQHEAMVAKAKADAAAKAAAEEAARLAAEAERKAAEEKEAEALASIVAEIVSLEEDVLSTRCARNDLIHRAKTEYADAIIRVYGSWNDFCKDGLGMHPGSVSNILKMWMSETVRDAYKAGIIGEWAGQTLGKEAARTDDHAMESKELHAFIEARESGELANDSRLVEAVVESRKEKKAAAEMRKRKARENAKSPLEHAEERVASCEEHVAFCADELKAAKADLKEARAELKALQSSDLADVGLSARVRRALHNAELHTIEMVREYDGDLTSVPGIGPKSASLILAAIEA